MIGANVVLRGTCVGVCTDIDGRFELEIPAYSDRALVVSYVGYTTIEMELGDKVNEVIEFQMEEGVVLDEIGIVGLSVEVVRLGMTGLGTIIANDTLALEDESEVDDSDEPEPQLSTFPNPFRDQINLNLQLIEKARYEIFLVAMDGAIVWNTSRKLGAGEHTVSMELGPNLPPAEYVVHVRWSGGQLNSIVIKGD